MTRKEFVAQYTLGTLSIKYLPRKKGQRRHTVVVNNVYKILMPYNVYRMYELCDPKNRLIKDRKVIRWILKHHKFQGDINDF